MLRRLVPKILDPFGKISIRCGNKISHSILLCKSMRKRRDSGIAERPLLSLIGNSSGIISETSGDMPNIPEFIGDIPEFIGNIPGVIGDIPEFIGDIPGVIGNIPRVIPASCRQKAVRRAYNAEG
jgi:hypothetical protein